MLKNNRRVSDHVSIKGMDMHWCKSPEVGLPKPDVVLYLTVPPDVAASRTSYGSERYENVDFQAKVDKNFRQLMDSDWKVGYQFVSSLLILQYC